MAEGCPGRAALEAFVARSLSDPRGGEVEAHLEVCLCCAEELDRITRTELNRLVGKTPATVALPGVNSPVLDQVIRRAAESGGALIRPDPNRVLELLDPSTTPGALGSFAGFDILEIAGYGGMGVVFKARDPTLDRDVAIKVIFPTGARDESFTSRLLDEARAVAALQHDHIVAVHHAGTAKGLPYLVMPFHAEGSLEQRLARTPQFALRDVAGVGWQLARALMATHARGILHRDLKPSNVLLDDGLMRVRLADFGLAQPVDATPDLTPHIAPARRTVVGTPHYMSPEQARGENLDARSDLFGLGAVLFHLATGKTLYPGDSSEEVLAAATQCHIKTVREVAPEVPTALATIIDRMLAKRPEDRFASAEEVVGEFERFIDSKHRLRRRVKRAALGTLAACLVVGAAMVTLDWSGQTVIINSLRCWRTGDGYYIRGRFGTYARLADAVSASRGGEILEARFSGERLTDGFRVGGKPLTLRAARGYTPALLATNNGQPLILVDAPLALEGFALWRRTDRTNTSPLIVVESGTLNVLNCRLVRALGEGEEVLLRGGRRVSLDSDQRIHRPLLTLASGSTTRLRNCLLLGNRGTAVGLRGVAPESLRVETDNSVFVIPRGFVLRKEAGSGVALASTRSVFVIATLLDLEQTQSLGQFTVRWEECLFDHSQGALLRTSQYGDGEWLRALDWKETNVVYAGQGTYLSDRRRHRIDAEVEWNDLIRLATNSHRLIARGAFTEARVRSSRQLSAVDVSTELLSDSTHAGVGFTAQWVGEGEPYLRFRGQPEYRQWQEDVRASTHAWEQHRAAGTQGTSR